MRWCISPDPPWIRSMWDPENSEFHKDYGHNTEDCFQLKEQIAHLIKRGYLRKYVANRLLPNFPNRRYGDNRSTAGNIQTIYGGFGLGGSSSSSQKRHAREANGQVEEEVYNLSMPVNEVHQTIAFTNDDLRSLHLPHDDELVVFTRIANFNVQIILVNNGSSVNILFISAFDKMKIGRDKLYPSTTLWSGLEEVQQIHWGESSCLWLWEWSLTRPHYGKISLLLIAHCPTMQSWVAQRWEKLRRSPPPII